MAINGRLPRSQLARIKGNGWLRKDAARAYNAMASAAARDGVDLSIWEQSVRRTYRPLTAQQLAWSIYPRGQAAVPGTSNHGWGLAVDLMNLTQRRWIDRHGARYGWSKRWSDAQHEWWHLKYRPGVYKPPKKKPDPLRFLTKGERDLVERLQYHRAGMKHEAKTGKGKKYVAHLKWARWYKKKIKRQMAEIARVVRRDRMNWKKLYRGKRYQILLKAYKGQL
jgi:hypothetical protein